MSRGQAVVDTATSNDKIWDAFRRWGYLQANIDPLGDLQPVLMPELDVNGPEADAARRYYCGSIGVEFMHIPDHARRQWIQDRMEAERGADEPEAHSRMADPRRDFRTGFADALSGDEAVFARRRSIAAASDGFDSHGGVRARRAAGGGGDEPSRPVERDGAHRGTRRRRKCSRASRMWTRAASWAAAT